MVQDSIGKLRKKAHRFKPRLDYELKCSILKDKKKKKGGHMEKNIVPLVILIYPLLVMFLDFF